MPRFRIDLRADAFRNVLGFTFGHWRRQPWRLTGIMGTFLLATLADVLTPLYSGRLVDAVASGALEPVVLKDGEDSATVPGLGFRAWA